MKIQGSLDNGQESSQEPDSFVPYEIFRQRRLDSIAFQITEQSLDKLISMSKEEYALFQISTGSQALADMESYDKVISLDHCAYCGRKIHPKINIVGDVSELGIRYCSFDCLNAFEKFQKENNRK